MRGLLTTSALIAPFLFSAALAQDPPPATPEATDEQTETAPLATEPTDDDPVEPADDTAPDPLAEPTDDAPEPAEPATDAPAPAEPATDAPAPAEPATDAPDPDAPADEALAPAEPAADAPVSEAIVREQAQNELRVDWITGTTVYSMQDERIGQIRDLIFDQEDQTITAAIVGVGGFLGIGAKQIAVRFDELEIDYDAREIRLNLTQDDADAAPEYVFRERVDAPAPPPPADTGTMGQPAAPLD